MPSHLLLGMEGNRYAFQRVWYAVFLLPQRGVLHSHTRVCVEIGVLHLHYCPDALVRHREACWKGRVQYKHSELSAPFQS